jgi:Holliday junction resolvase RusA-like endonuclease
MSVDRVQFTCPLKIKAKPRPKVTRTGQVYYADADYMSWRGAVLAKALLASSGQQIEGELFAKITIYEDCFTVELEKLADPRVYIRCDIDNGMGAVFDAIQGKKGERGLIKNDRQIREVHCRIAEKGERP